MAQAVPAIIAVVGLAMSAYSIRQQQKAAGRVKRAAQLNAQFKREETDEEIRRRRRQAQHQEALGRASAGASGFFGESFNLVLDEIHQANEEQLQWLQKSGESQAAIIAAGGQVQADTLQAQSINTATTGLYSAYQIYQSGQ